MYEDVGMAIPKTMETRCSYGSMQEAGMILHAFLTLNICNPIPTSFLKCSTKINADNYILLTINQCVISIYAAVTQKRCRDRVTYV